MARAGLWTYIAFFLAQVNAFDCATFLDLALESFCCHLQWLHDLAAVCATMCLPRRDMSPSSLEFAASLSCKSMLQVFSTVIAAFGFNGYGYPTEPHNNAFENCEFCQYAYKNTAGGYPAFFSRKVPQARTENVFIESTIGCT